MEDLQKHINGLKKICNDMDCDDYEDECDKEWYEYDDADD